MTLAAIKQKESTLLLPTYERYEVLLRHGKGVHVYDHRGRKYLDFLSGIGVNALGYGHPAIQRAIKRQSARLIHSSNLFFHDYQSALAQLLTQMAGLDRAFFCNSGTEAWEGALKFARAYARSRCANGRNPKWRVLTMQDSFHGRTFGALATTGTKKYRTPFMPLMPGVIFVRFNDVDDLLDKFDDSICAIGLEVVQGEGGIRPIDRQFLRVAKALTKKHGALLLVDEIQSGLGRTGKMFAYQHYDLLPDIVTVAKPLAAGLPLGAILTTDEVSRCLHPGMHGTTFGGGPLACAVALAFLETIEKQGLLRNVREVGKYLLQRLAALKDHHAAIVDVRGLGLMAAVELNSADLTKSVVQKMLARGIIINRTHNTVLRFLPPYIVQNSHVDRLVDELDEILKEETQKGPNQQLAARSQAD